MELPPRPTNQEITNFLNSKKSKEQLISEIQTLKEEVLMYRAANIDLRYQICDLKEKLQKLNCSRQ